MSRSNVVIHPNSKKLEKRKAEVTRMTNEQKGFLLLDNVRNLAIGSGEDEDEIIALITTYGGLVDAVLAASQNMLAEEQNRTNRRAN